MQIDLTQSSLSSCFLSTAATMLSVIQGLFKVVSLVTLGFSNLQVESRALPKMSVNSENLFVISWPAKSSSSLVANFLMFSFENS